MRLEVYEMTIDMDDHSKGMDFGSNCQRLKS